MSKGAVGPRQSVFNDSGLCVRKARRGLSSALSDMLKRPRESVLLQEKTTVEVLHFRLHASRFSFCAAWKDFSRAVSSYLPSFLAPPSLASESCRMALSSSLGFSWQS